MNNLKISIALLMLSASCNAMMIVDHSHRKRSWSHTRRRSHRKRPFQQQPVEQQKKLVPQEQPISQEQQLEEQLGKRLITLETQILQDRIVPY